MKKDIYELAEECGLLDYHPVNPPTETYRVDLFRFSQMIAAREREQIATMLDLTNKIMLERMHESDHRTIMLKTHEDIVKLLRSQNV